MVRKAIRTVAFVLFAVLVAPFAGHAKVIKPPTAALNQKISLTCWIDNNHLNVGSAHAMRKGTQIS